MCTRTYFQKQSLITSACFFALNASITNLDTQLIRLIASNAKSEKNSTLPSVSSLTNLTTFSKRWQTVNKICTWSLKTHWQLWSRSKSSLILSRQASSISMMLLTKLWLTYVYHFLRNWKTHLWLLKTTYNLSMTQVLLCLSYFHHLYLTTSSLNGFLLHSTLRYTNFQQMISTKTLIRSYRIDFSLLTNNTYNIQQDLSKAMLHQAYHASCWRAQAILVNQGHH